MDAHTLPTFPRAIDQTDSNVRDTFDTFTLTPFASGRFRVKTYEECAGEVWAVVQSLQPSGGWAPCFRMAARLLPDWIRDCRPACVSCFGVTDRVVTQTRTEYYCRRCDVFTVPPDAEGER